MSAKMKIGIIGCGNISKAYLSNGPSFNDIEIVACADINMDAAKAKAEEFKIKVMTVDELLKSPEIELVVNLTIPAAHAEINLRALNAGKHVHCEKPLAITLADGKKIIDLAKKKKLRVGCAPDTFLGAGLQTSRKIIDDGWIGKPLAGTAFMMGRGPEAWHPNPFFFYQTGAGPMFDLGPYYMTALVHLLGPVKTVSACTQASFPVRIAGCKEHFGAKIKVEVPTHCSGTLEFWNGAMITVVMSWECWKHAHSPIEIYGSEGSMMVPDPNGFGGPVKVYRPGNENWSETVLTHKYAKNSRIIGAADIAAAVKKGRPHRASGELAYHVLEIMHAFELSSKSRKHYVLKSKCDQPAPLPTDLMEGMLD
ncbi:MAG TPA: oxidoreductase [Lentisphaeria bacterium]|nr:MAG: oxidoreductase [Lentisphaerae bacterium GWF2_50_93]HCE42391.1 oxidoreductase [Lentisphaeria bacterium]